MGLFGFNAEKKLAKAKEQLAGGLAYDARRAFEEILVRDDVAEGILGQAREGWRAARRTLLEGQVAQARAHLEAGERDEARESCLAAIDQAQEDLDASEARAMLEEIDAGRARPQRTLLDGLEEVPAQAPARAEEAEESEDPLAVSVEDPEAIFEVHLAALPDAQAERLRSFGPGFREGFLALQEGRFEEALAAFDQIPTPASEDAAFRLEKAQALLQLRRDEEALALLEGISLEGEAERRRAEMRVILLGRLHRGEECEREARSLWEASARDVESSILFAEILLDQGKAEEALDAIRPHMRVPRPQPEVERLAARAYHQSGRVVEARDLLERTVEAFFQGPSGMQAPRFPIWAAHDLLGLYVELREDPEKIRSIAQHVILHDPEAAQAVRDLLARHAETLAREAQDSEDGKTGDP